MSKFQDTSIKNVIAEINKTFFVPDIQREYVWLSNPKEKKIEQLFDSILHGYPIGCFLFWTLKKSDIQNNPDLNFQLYKFIEKYDTRTPSNIHNPKIDLGQITPGGDADLHIVLDGQQRLTSLYIGLVGSKTLKKLYARSDNNNAYEEKKLYLNLKHIPDENDPEDCYEFSFLNEKSAKVSDSSQFWFKVGKVLDFQNIGDVYNFCLKNNIVEAGDMLSSLWSAICDKNLIAYFEEKDKSLEKVLKIFIRVNSGGMILSYSDLLMSILTSAFSIKDEMNELVDSIKQDEFGVFGRDQVLKTCLLLARLNPKFQIKSFNKGNIAIIEENWKLFTDNIKDAVHLVKDFGYSNRLSQSYIITVIALYLNRKGYKYKDCKKEDRKSMWQFTKIAQIQGYFTAGLDGKLVKVADYMNQATDFKSFMDKLATDELHPLKITADDIDRMLTLRYGNPATLPVLQILYPMLNYTNKRFQIDHIYPKSKFKKSNKLLNEQYLEDKDYLFNLQLLEEFENMEDKKDKDPDKWIESSFKNKDEKDKYKKDNYIEESCTLSWKEFGDFKEQRTKEIRLKLLEAFQLNPTVTEH